MKVILDVESLHGKLTGIGRYSYELAARLPVEVGAPIKYWNGYSFQDAVTYQHFNKGESPSLKDILRRLMFNRYTAKVAALLPRGLKHWVKRLLRFNLQSDHVEDLAENSDHLFHGPNFVLPNHSGKTVVTIHDLSVFRFPEYHPSDRVKFMSVEVPKALERADAIIAISEFTKQELLHYFPLTEEKIHVVPNGASKPVVVEYTKNDSEVLQNLCLENRSFFLCVSTIEPRKNLSTLLSAYLQLARDIRKKNPLVLVGGDGWKSTHLMKQIQLAQDEGVRYLGYIDQPTLEALYKSAKAFVFPSLYEGFGLPAIEAMGYGLPVVCASDTAVSEVCAGDALEFDGHSADELAIILERLVTDEVLRRRLSEASRKRAGDYSWERCCRETVAVYRSAMSDI
ncbi:glycosyltransferase family 4 protein [Microbulbifer variabilis]|uniref:glycosyltransferase family 4 protein n=1 Tax=Microbulbifer variabilis TaxID=266805 RepID=UPI001CFD3402|nr:glycosyltransferase family 1 protein [Microbulbifer variabilis]